MAGAGRAGRGLALNPENPKGTGSAISKQNLASHCRRRRRKGGNISLHLFSHGPFGGREGRIPSLSLSFIACLHACMEGLWWGRGLCSAVSYGFLSIFSFEKRTSHTPILSSLHTGRAGRTGKAVNSWAGIASPTWNLSITTYQKFPTYPSPSWAGC